MTPKENFRNYLQSLDGGSRSSGLLTLSVVPKVGLGVLTVLPVDPVGELAEGSRVAWELLVDTRGVGEIWRDSEKPEKAKGSQRHVRRKTATFLRVYP